MQFGDVPFDFPPDDSIIELKKRLDDEFFDKLTAVGKRKISMEARQFLLGTLIGYLEFVKGLKLTGRKPTTATKLDAKIKKAMAERSIRLSVDVEVWINGKNEDVQQAVRGLPEDIRDEALARLRATLRIDRFTLLPAALLDFANEIYPPPPQRVGNRERQEDRQLLPQLAEFFHRIGGRPTVSQGGPFGRFLKEIWSVLPKDARAASAESFVRLALTVTQDLQKHVKGLPRSLMP